ncbi:hypothetical protein ACIRLA_46310 [Streptomyces sp. NPDC102364]|uniref:hypothetical protein n=1 Tax=Streptomyces sp. NPDC102364 TaxID=3366161 RepID=UPI0038202E7B
MTSSDDPVMDIKQIAAEIFPGTAESTVNGWARDDRDKPKGTPPMFGRPVGKIGRAPVWYRSQVIAGAQAAGRLDAAGRSTQGARGPGAHRKPPEGPQYDDDGMRLRTRAQVMAVFGVYEGKRSEATVRSRWMGGGVRGFPKTPDKRVGVNPMWRDDTLTRWADAQGIEYDLDAVPPE